MPWTLRPIELMRAGRFALIDGGRGVLSPTYVDDLVAGIVAVATHPAAVGEVFHVTGGSGVPAADFFGRYAAMLGIPKLRSAPSRMLRLAAPLLERLPLGFSPRAIEYLTHPGTYSIEKARRLLGWEPQVSLDDGMARTEQWLRERGLLG
jgi:nucleoside-diphosphate-sugar epimerase